MKTKLKMVMMMGLPGAGKSTYVKQRVDQNTVVVSRDAIRQSLNGGVYLYDENREDMVESIEYDMIYRAFENGFNVLIDETNLTRKRRRSHFFAAKEFNADVEIIHLTTSVDICIDRRAEDLKADDYDGTRWAETIKNCANSFEMIYFDEAKLYSKIEVF